MFLEEIKQLKTGPRELRKFGLVVGAVLAALGLLLWARGRGYYLYLLAPGLALLLLGAAVPRTLKHIYIAWMALAIGLGFVVSNVILILFFFLVITPIGLVARLFGKDFLRLKLDTQTSTYWLPREKKPPRTKAEYEQQF